MDQSKQDTMRPVMLAGAGLGTLVLLASIHCILSLLGKTPWTWPIFFSWLAALSAVNGILLLFCWHRRHALSPSAQLRVLFWGGISVWYWCPASLCFYLGVNTDRAQLSWGAFAFLWEVPIIGWLWVAWGLWVFRPLEVFLKEKPLATTPLRLYQAAMRYPVTIAGTLVVITLIGFLFALFQLGFFASLPPIELVKTTLLGVASCAFHAVFFYLCLDSFLRPIRARIEQTFELTAAAKGKLVHKIAGITLATMIGSAALLGLFGLQAFQLIIKEQVHAALRNGLEELAAADKAGASAHELENLLKKWHASAGGYPVLLNPGDRLPPNTVAQETQRVISEQRAGLVADGAHELKLVGFMDSAVLGKQIVWFMPLTGFYGPLRVIIRYVMLAGLFAMFLVIGIVVVVSLTFTHAVRTLASAVSGAETNEAPYAFHLDTADELEDLSHACAHFIHESRTLRQQLEASLQEMEDMLRVVSHDLRTPLINITGFSKRLEPILQETLRTFDEVLAHGQANGLGTQVEALRAQVQTQFAQSIQFIAKSVDKMDLLLTALLSISRVGRIADPIEANNLNAVLDETLPMFAHQLTERGIRVIRHPLPASVPCRRHEISQVFANLLSNAIKYMGSSAPGVIEIGATASPHQAECFVRDNGIGIDPADQERIFLMFTRLYAVDVPGDGIGLTYVKKILRGHGGTIRVVSQPGQGSTFFFTLPMRPAPYPSLPPAH